MGFGLIWEFRVYVRVDIRVRVKVGLGLTLLGLGVERIRERKLIAQALRPIFFEVISPPLLRLNVRVRVRARVRVRELRL